MIVLFRRVLLAGSAALPGAPLVIKASTATAPSRPVDLAAGPSGSFAVAPPHACDADEPPFHAQTMRLHHDGHHAAPVKNLIGGAPIDEVGSAVIHDFGSIDAPKAGFDAAARAGTLAV